MKEHIDAALNILLKVFSEGAYVNMAFYGGESSDMTTRLVYGTLEKNVYLDYILNQLLDKKPKNDMYILLKIGAYSLMFLDSVPDYAIVSECVEVAKRRRGKDALGGFINAVLKKISARQFSLPDADSPDFLSVRYSKPSWFIDKMLKQYGGLKTFTMLDQPEYDLEHLRINRVITTPEAVKNALISASVSFEISSVGGIIARSVPQIRKMFDEGAVTFQSPSSITAVDALAPKDGGRILDLCSAPGGKAVYAAEKCPHSLVTACDIHPHRISLIQKYKHRMHTPNVKPVLQDARILREEWRGAFDYVLVDAPCSCFGTYRKHPDVFLQRGDDAIAALAQQQKKILANAAQYVAPKGVLVYSTCTLFCEENQQVVETLTSSGKFIPETAPVPIINNGFISILPKEEWDGFFIARLRRND